jgi:diguanylate cyclase (GGDEF)-like protein
MRIRIRTKQQMWLFVGAATVISVAASQLALLLTSSLTGGAALGWETAFYTALIVPVLVAVPVSFFIARMALQLNHAQSRLHRLALTDELTGLMNRRAFFESAEGMLESAGEEGRVLSLLVMDADYFKQLNDTYGHATGDAALQFITEHLNENVRTYDLVCRLGSEEFAILLPDLAEPEAAELGNRILERIASRPMFWDDKIIEMSVSCGVADTRVGYGMSPLFKAADDALYAAKTSGRNRQISHSRMSPPSPKSVAMEARA